MKALLASVVVAVAMIQITGCSGGGGEKNLAPAERYLPLQQGNWWRYDVTDYTVEQADAFRGVRVRLPLTNRRVEYLPQASTAQVGPGIGIATTSVTGTRSIDGSLWHEVTTTLHDSGQEPTMQYFRHDENGLQSRAAPSLPAYYRILAPIVPGTTWVPPFDANDESIILSVTAQVQVDAGTFTDCLLVQEAWDEEVGRVRVISWFAPDLGMVRSEDYVGDTLTGEAKLAAHGVAQR